MYRLFLHAGVEKQLARFPRPFAEWLTQAIRGLAANPRPAQVKSLGQELYRLRVGNYRIVYAVFDDKQEIVVCKVARRVFFNDDLRFLVTREPLAVLPGQHVGERFALRRGVIRAPKMTTCLNTSYSSAGSLKQRKSVYHPARWRAMVSLIRLCGMM